MGWKVIFAPQALEELEQIVRFIARDDPNAAIRFGDYLVDRAELLANFPEMGTPYRKRGNVRRLSCKSYYIYSRLDRKEQMIEIIVAASLCGGVPMSGERTLPACWFRHLAETNFFWRG